MKRDYVYIPQQGALFRSKLRNRVVPLDPCFIFAIDYDLWVRFAEISTIRYHPRTWAAFRLHSEGKTRVAADCCWPEMSRVHRRLGGSSFSVIYAKHLLRRLLQPILPYRLPARLWLQQWAMANVSSGSNSR